MAYKHALPVMRKQRSGVILSILSVAALSAPHKTVAYKTTKAGMTAFAAYRPSLPEVGLGLGGVALAVAITLIGVKVLRILPQSLTGGETEAAPRAV